MKMLNQLPAALCVALIAVAAGCRESKKKPDVVAVAQDTMLLRDLAEANRNTAAAATVDNSLNTVVRPSPTDSAKLTSGQRLAPPVRANDAPAPTMVPIREPPATGSTGPSSGDPCDSPDADDQRTCLNRSITQNDAELNRTYQDLIAQSRKSGGAELEQRLRDAQREWVNERDDACRTAGDGALWARARARCLAEYSGKRTAELRRNLNSLRGQ
jgi:uncharacterized protein YecT (DUF1311 family)